MNLRHRLKSLEARVASLMPNAVTLTLGNGKRIQVSESRLQAICDQAKAIISSTGDWNNPWNSPRTLTDEEVARVDGMRDILNAEPPYPPAVERIRLLANGPIGFYCDLEGVEHINLVGVAGPIIRVTFVDPERPLATATDQ